MLESKDNVYELPNLTRDELTGALEFIQRNITLYEQFTKQLARIRKKAYDAYIAEGFKPEQAVILCQNMRM